MRRTLPLVAVSVILAVSSLRADAPSDGLKYYIGKHIVVMTTSITDVTTRKISVATEASCTRMDSGAIIKPSDPGKDLCVETTSITTRTGSAALQLVADMTLPVPVATSTPALVDEESSIELTDGLLLKSINVTSTGRAGDVLTSLAKFVATTFVPFGFNRSPPAPVTENPAAPGACDPFKKPFADLPDAARLWLWRNDMQCRAWKTLSDLQDQRDARVKDRDALVGAIRSATGKELEELYKKKDTLDDHIDTLEKDIAARQKVFDAGLAAFTTSLNLGATSTTHAESQVLELTQLPKSTGLAGGVLERDVKTDDFSPAAKELWEAARVIVTLDGTVPACGASATNGGQPAAATGATAAAGKSTGTNGATGAVVKSPAATVASDAGGRSTGTNSTSCGKVPASSDSKRNVLIAFRQGTPVRLRVFVSSQQADPDPNKPAAPATLGVASDQWVNVMHPDLPVQAIAFTTSAWSKRDFSMTFDASGRPVTARRSSTSSVAALTSAMAAAASAARDEFTTTLDKAVQADADRRTLQMSDLTVQLDKLKKQKDILDAQVQLDAAGTNRDAVLKQQQAAADLATLQAQIALQTAQDNQELNREIDQLKLKLSKLQEQIDILQAQQQLKTLKKSGDQ
jgi:hypothetical protein